MRLETTHCLVGQAIQARGPDAAWLRSALTCEQRPLVPVAVQDEQAVAIGAFDPAGLVHVQVDAGMAQRAFAAVAGYLHRAGMDGFGGLRR